MNPIVLILPLLVVCVGGKNPKDGDVRLIDGPNQDQGVAQMYLNGEWGYICDGHGLFVNGWPTVFCQTKNGEDSAATEAKHVRKLAQKDASFKDLMPSKGALMTFQMPDCWPREVKKMIDCFTHRKTKKTVCRKAHKKVVYVKCKSALNVCEDGDVRLIDGPTEDQGVAQMCLNGEWGYICDGPGFSKNGWASVLCKTKNGPDSIATEALYVKKKAKEDQSLKDAIPPEGALMTFQMPDCWPRQVDNMMDCLTNRRTMRTLCDPSPHRKVVYVKCE